MQIPNITRSFILTVIGITLLVCILLTGVFAFPIGLPLCALIGLVYGLKCKDKLFIRFSSATLLIGVICIIYTYLTIQSM